MSLVLMDLGVKQRLIEMKTSWNAAAIILALFKSNTIPTTADTLATYTESTFAGYARQNIVTWGVPVVTAHVARMVAATNTFTRNATGAAENIYGYLVLDTTGTFLLWAERDANAPIVVTNNGDSYTVTPALDDRDIST
jgi:hypothetical protein